MNRIGPLLPLGPGDSSVRHGSRRRSRRYPLNAEVAVIEPVSAEGIAINASAGGLRVMLDREVSEGESCLLELRFTEDRASRETARVIWAQQHPDGWVVGLEFLNVTWFIPSSSRGSRAA